MMPQSEIANPQRPFQAEAAAVLYRLRAALAEVVAQVPGQVDSAADLERVLGIRKTLAWQVFKIAHAQNPLAAGLKLPGRLAMERFFEAAGQASVPSHRIDAARKAIAEFSELVRRHADDRAGFDSMLAGIAGDQTPADLTHRRAAYNANSHIWGVQVRTRFTTLVYHPTDDGLVDELKIRGVTDLRQLRADRPFVLSRTHVEQAAGNPVEEPIDPLSYQRHGVSLLPEFCSDPDLTVRTYTDSNGELVAELAPPAIGRAGAVSAVVASCYRRCGRRHPTPEMPTVDMIGRVDMPYKAYLIDVLVVDGAYGDRLPEMQASVIGRHLSGWNELRGALAHQTLWQEPVIYLGRGASALATADVPRYAEIVEHATGKLGWNPDRFQAFRCRVEYPVMPSTVVVQLKLPQ